MVAARLVLSELLRRRLFLDKVDGAVVLLFFFFPFVLSLVVVRFPDEEALCFLPFLFNLSKRGDRRLPADASANLPRAALPLTGVGVSALLAVSLAREAITMMDGAR